MILDVETPFITRKLESYTPANFGLVEHGPVLVREALASSYNIPAVVALEQVGVPEMIQLTSNAGLTTLAENKQVDLSITLGGGEVRLLDMAGAYSIFANGGYRVEPTFILKVAKRDGDLRCTNGSRPHSTNNCWMNGSRPSSPTSSATLAPASRRSGPTVRSILAALPPPKPAPPPISATTG